MDQRLRFLEEFLGALGARRIEWSIVEAAGVRGTVVYDEGDPEERQDFVWAVTEAQVPSEDVVALASMIRTQRLLSIDKLVVGSDELRKRYCELSGRICGKEAFERILEELESVEVPMLDDGVKSDAYFIHQ